MVIEVAKAEANGTKLRDMGAVEGGGEGDTEGVAEDCGTDEEDIPEEPHEGVVAIKGDAPGVRVLNINHGSNDTLGSHAAFAKGFTCVRYPPELVHGGGPSPLPITQGQLSS